MTLSKENLISFVVYRWVQDDCFYDYPFIAIAEDHSIFMSLGDYGLSFESAMSNAVESSLGRDFAPTGEHISCDFATLRRVFDGVFSGGVRSGVVRFDATLRPRLINISLSRQVLAEDGPEYLIQGLRNYHRMYREPVRLSGVSVAERAMLDVCTSIFSDFARAYGEKLREPLPPRYRDAAEKNANDWGDWKDDIDSDDLEKPGAS